MLLLSCLILAADAAPDADRQVQRRLAAMGTSLDLTVVAADRATALLASEAAVVAMESVEARLSTWRPTSELSLLNATAVGEWTDISPDLSADLALASWCHQQTGGAFDPAIGPLVDAWGLRRPGPPPDGPALSLAIARSGLGQLETAGLRARRLADVWVDAGGFGKGVALDAGIQAARQAGATRILLDLGGQLAAHDYPLAVDVSDPRDRARAVQTISLVTGSVATSSHSEKPGHLLDPATGRIAPDFGSLTVVTASAARADCLSTGLFVLGPQAALRWAQDHADVQVVVVERQGQDAIVYTGERP